MNPAKGTLVGWALAVAAVAVGYATWGWPGVLMALSVVVFWLLLQFSRAMRVLRRAATQPKGSIESAVMFNSRLNQGLQMLQVVRLAGSLGEPVGAAAADGTEAWRWHDAGGDAVEVQLRGGHVLSWALRRADT